MKALHWSAYLETEASWTGPHVACCWSHMVLARYLGQCADGHDGWVHGDQPETWLTWNRDGHGPWVSRGHPSIWIQGCGAALGL